MERWIPSKYFLVQSNMKQGNTLLRVDNGIHPMKEGFPCKRNSLVWGKLPKACLDEKGFPFPSKKQKSCLDRALKAFSPSEMLWSEEKRDTPPRGDVIWFPSLLSKKWKWHLEPIILCGIYCTCQTWNDGFLKNIFPSNQTWNEGIICRGWTMKYVPWWRDFLVQGK